MHRREHRQRPTDTATSSRRGRGIRLVLSLLVILTAADVAARWSHAESNPADRSAHPAFERQECDQCHWGSTGTALRDIEGGLCLTSCHTDLLDGLKVLHGPLNLDDCTPCHVFHESLYPKLLMSQASGFCFRCHSRSAFRQTRHHEIAASKSCLECHNPHGGKNRFFVETPLATNHHSIDELEAKDPGATSP